jgi:hypothetical protein
MKSENHMKSKAIDQEYEFKNINQNILCFSKSLLNVQIQSWKRLIHRDLANQDHAFDQEVFLKCSVYIVDYQKSPIQKQKIRSNIRKQPQNKKLLMLDY